jgi:putative endonuclease
MTQARRQRIGQWGETRAAQYLEGKGYEILARNVRTAYGEIDMIARDRTGLVFVEVKTRTNLKYGYPEQAVTRSKMEHMVAAAQAYMTDHTDLEGWGWRIDVIALLRAAGKPAVDVEIVHFENVA